MKRPEKRELIVGEARFAVVKVYEDILGNTWYGFEDPLRMPSGRALAGEIAATWCDMNLDAEAIRDYFSRMRKSFNEGNIVHALRLMDCMEERLQWACEDKTLLGLAKVYYMLNDEPINQPNNESNQEKERVWEKDADCRAFFLLKAFVLMKGSLGFSQTDILNYLTVQHAKEAKGAELKVQEQIESQPVKRRRKIVLPSFKKGSTA